MATTSNDASTPAAPSKDSESAPSSRRLFSKDPKRKPSKKGKEVVTRGSDNIEAKDTNGSTMTTANGAGPAPASQSTAGDVAPAVNLAQPESATGASEGQDPTQSAAAVPASPPQQNPADKGADASPPVSAESSHASDAKEKDKGSLSTTITGTASNSKHRKTKSASEGAHSSSTDKSLKPKTATKQKKSFLSKLVHSFLPCVSPPKHARIDDDVGSELSEPGSTAAPLKEKHILPESKDTPANKQVIAIPETTTTTQSADSASSSTIIAPLTIAPNLAPPPSTDPAVVVPPSPTKQVLPESETGGLTSGAVQPPGSTGDEHTRDVAEDSDGTSFTEDEDLDKELESAEDEEERLIMNGGVGIPIGPDGVPRPLLPPIAPHHAGRKCLVLDMDETLLHSSFKSIQHADYVIPVEIEYHWHNVYVIKRPGVDNFLKKMGELYEVVVFTASLSKYADPVLDKLDVHQVVSHRLFRESCYNHKGNYVKDLSQLGRPMADTIILDNSPASYIFHPNNAVPVSSWFNDPHDTELTDLCPFLADLRTVDDVRGVLDGGL